MKRIVLVTLVLALGVFPVSAQTPSAPKVDPARLRADFPFAAAGDFSEGVAPAAVLKPDPANPDSQVAQWGFVDAAGHWVIKPQFANAHSFHGGFASAAITEPARREEVRDINGGINFVNIDAVTHWGLVDRSGRWVLQPLYDDAGDFSEGLTPCRMKEQWAYVDKDGTTVIKNRFVAAGPFHEGLAAVRLVVPKLRFSERLWGYINKTGEFVVEPRFDEADGFFQGKAVAKSAGRTYVVDKSGNVSEPSAAQLEALAAAGRQFPTPVQGPNGKWGYADARNKVVIRQQFDAARPFVAGWACVGMKDAGDRMRFGLINKTGSFLRLVPE